jgi:hypothetical protein
VTKPMGVMQQTVFPMRLMQLAQKAPFFAGKPPPSQKPLQKPAPVLLSLDVDDTWIGWKHQNQKGIPVGLAKANVFLKKQQEQWFTLLNTGRGLASLTPALEGLAQKAPKLFDGLVFDALAINNGQSLFVNRSQLPLMPWLKGLSSKKQDKGWQTLQTQWTGWKGKEAIDAVERGLVAQGVIWEEEALPQAGLGPQAKGKKLGQVQLISLGQPFSVEVVMYPDQPGFRLSLPKKQAKTPFIQLNQELALTRWGEQVAKRWLKEQKAKGWDVALRKRVFQDPEKEIRQWVYVFSPKAVHKAKVVEYVLKQKAPANTQAVISAGDDPYNDTEVLVSQFVNQLGQNIPNLAIAVGGFKEAYNGLMEAVSQNPLLLRVAENDVLSGLKFQNTRQKNESQKT